MRAPRPRPGQPPAQVRLTPRPAPLGRSPRPGPLGGCSFGRLFDGGFDRAVVNLFCVRAGALHLLLGLTRLGLRVSLLFRTLGRLLDRGGVTRGAQTARGLRLAAGVGRRGGASALARRGGCRPGRFAGLSFVGRVGACTARRPFGRCALRLTGFGCCFGGCLGLRLRLDWGSGSGGGFDDAGGVDRQARLDGGCFAGAVGFSRVRSKGGEHRAGEVPLGDRLRHLVGMPFVPVPAPAKPACEVDLPARCWITWVASWAASLRSGSAANAIRPSVV